MSETSRMRRRHVALVVCLMTIALAGCSEGSKTQQSQIAGVVVGSGGPAPGTVLPLSATVTLRTASGEVLHTQRFSAGGEFTFTAQAGDYIVEADCGGSVTVKVKADQPARAQITCPIA